MDEGMSFEPSELDGKAEIPSVVPEFSQQAVAQPTTEATPPVVVDKEAIQEKIKKLIEEKASKPLVVPASSYGAPGQYGGGYGRGYGGYQQGQFKDTGLRGEMPKWLTTSSLRELASKPINWVAKGLFTRKAKVLIAAEPKVGKTFVVCSMAVSIASGLPLWGKIEILDPGPIGIVGGEDDESEIARRLDRMARAMGLSMTDLPIHFLPAAGVRLNRPRDQEFMRKAVRDLKLKMIVYDPLSRLMDGDENSKETVSQVLNPASDLANNEDVCVCLVHHMAKQSADNPRSAMTRVRGSSDITGWFTCGIFVSGTLRSGKINVEVSQRVSGRIPGEFAIDVVEVQEESLYGLGTMKLQARFDKPETSDAPNEKFVQIARGKILDLLIAKKMLGITMSEITVHLGLSKPIINAALKQLILEDKYVTYGKDERIPDGRIILPTPLYSDSFEIERNKRNNELALQEVQEDAENRMTIPPEAPEESTQQDLFSEPSANDATPETKPSPEDDMGGLFE